jgi:hypothetical protein
MSVPNGPQPGPAPQPHQTKSVPDAAALLQKLYELYSNPNSPNGQYLPAVSEGIRRYLNTGSTAGLPVQAVALINSAISGTQYAGNPAAFFQAMHDTPLPGAAGPQAVAGPQRPLAGGLNTGAGAVLGTPAATDTPGNAMSVTAASR